MNCQPYPVPLTRFQFVKTENKSQSSDDYEPVMAALHKVLHSKPEFRQMFRSAMETEAKRIRQEKLPT